ncbi:hypothetical protein [Yinghuangia soli]|uniref:Uncharacterized protein n=1 Tax=Yinghuangia soli TaxID=2908204 RepID=A0AA41Q5L5_9ACTN|nr:hypothetical protein [Yinghuangia soli]MCF2531731.1 hypothetical protein [Yinghuangia soli]
MTDPRHTAHLAVEVRFEGDYYGPDELVALCDGWIGAAFEDRDNLRGYTLTGSVNPGHDTAPNLDADPAALAWARGKIQHHIDKLNRFRENAAERGDSAAAEQWRRIAGYMSRYLIAGGSCTIGSFDERLPDWAVLADNTEDTPR